MIVVDASTVKLTASYVESSQDADGTALTDLAYTNVYYQIGSAPPVRGPQVPASAPSGGGTISTTILVPVAAGSKATITAWVTETDTLGNESAPSTTVTLSVDRLLPKAPTNFTIS